MCSKASSLPTSLSEKLVHRDPLSIMLGFPYGSPVHIYTLV